jgi:hypothetical protein
MKSWALSQRNEACFLAPKQSGLVYKESAFLNIRFTKCPVFKTSLLVNSTKRSFSNKYSDLTYVMFVWSGQKHKDRINYVDPDLTHHKSYFVYSAQQN